MIKNANVMSKLIVLTPIKLFYLIQNKTRPLKVPFLGIINSLHRTCCSFTYYVSSTASQKVGHRDTKLNAHRAVCHLPNCENLIYYYASIKGEIVINIVVKKIYGKNIPGLKINGNG